MGEPRTSEGGRAPEMSEADVARRALVVLVAVAAASAGAISLLARDAPEPATQAETTGASIRYDAGAGTDGETILIAGGTYATLATGSGGEPSFAPANEATRYDTSGRVVSTTAIEVPAGRYLFAPSVFAAHGRVLVAGGFCTIPVTTSGGCASAAVPALFSVDRSVARVVDTGAAELDDSASRRPGDGRLIAVGAVADHTLLVQPVGEGPHPGTSRLRLLRYSNDGRLDELPLPEGILTTRSLCATDVGVVAVTPQLGPGLRITALDLHHMGATAPDSWQKVATIPVEPPMTSSAGGVTCTGATAAVWIENSASTPVWRVSIGTRPFDGTKPTQLPGLATGTATSGRVIFTVREGVDSVSYWDFTVAAGGRRLGAAKLETPLQARTTLGVALRGGVFDVGEFLTAVPGQRATPRARFVAE